MEKSICSKCENDVKETYTCEMCNEGYCYDCGAEFTSTSCIDYNCCKSCAAFDREMEIYDRD